MADGTGAARQGGAPEGSTEYRPPALPWVHRLQFRLAALVFLAVLPLLGLLLYDHLASRDAAIRSAGREAGRLARIAARNQEEALRQAQAHLEAIAEAPVVREGAEEARRAFLADLLARSPGFRDFHLVRPDGGILASALPAAESKSLSDLESVARALKTGKTAVGSFRADPSSGPSVYIARPLTVGGGASETVLGATVVLGWLTQFQRALDLPGDSVLQVLDPGGDILLRVGEAGSGSVGGQHPALRPLRDVPLGEDRPVVVADADGVRRFFGMAPLRTGGTREGFMVVVGIPEERFVGGLDRTLRISLIVTLAALLLTLGMSRVLGDRLILRRVNGLILATRRLASTDLSKLKARTRVCQDPSELGDLERSFDEMAKALEKRAQDLEARAREISGKGG